MNREGAETFLRLLAETEIRGPMTAALRLPWSADAPGGSMVTAAEALIAVQALDGETAEQILTDFDLAAIVRAGHPQPAPAAPAGAARPRPGQLRFTIPRRYGIPPALGTTPSAPPRPGEMERFVPVGVSVPFGDDEFTGALHLLCYAHVASGAVFAATWSIRQSAAPYTIFWSRPRALTWRFIVTDDRGQRYDLDTTSGDDPVSDMIWLRPNPPPDIRWLDFSAPGTFPVRVELAAAADGEPEISEVRLSAGEQLLIMIAERLMALAAHFPPDQQTRPVLASWPGPARRPPSASPGALDATAAGLGTIIAALEAAGALSPLSPVPGWLSTLCASLNISGHGITVRPVRDLPDPWLSLLAYCQRRKPDTGPAHDGFAAMTVALPELDGIRLVLLGLHTTGGVTSLHALARGLNPEARAGPCGIETYFPLSVWIRNGGGRWHAVQPSGWQRAGPEYALQLWLVPPLPRSATWIEVLAAGRSAQVRARLTLRWGFSP
jgi:hypothetical protein